MNDEPFDPSDFLRRHNETDQYQFLLENKKKY